MQFLSVLFSRHSAKFLAYLLGAILVVLINKMVQIARGFLVYGRELLFLVLIAEFLDAQIIFDSYPGMLEHGGKGGRFLKLSTGRIFHIFLLYLLFFQDQSPSILKNSSPATKCNNVWKHMLSLNSDVTMMS